MEHMNSRQRVEPASNDGSDENNSNTKLLPIIPADVSVVLIAVVAVVATVKAMRSAVGGYYLDDAFFGLSPGNFTDAMQSAFWSGIIGIAACLFYRSKWFRGNSFIAAVIGVVVVLILSVEKWYVWAASASV